MRAQCDEHADSQQGWGFMILIFFGTESEPNCGIIFRTRGRYTSAPRIVGLRGENADSSSVALHGRGLYGF